MTVIDLNPIAKSYREDGYAVLENFFDAGQVAVLNGAISQTLAAEEIGSVAEVEPGDPKVARRIWSPTTRHPAFGQAAADPRLLDVIEQLIGPDILFHYSKLHLKAPRVGSEVDWHQDFAFYPHTNTDLVTAMIYLDDATVENACLRVSPGSHRLGLADHRVDGWFRGKVTGPQAPSLESAVALEAPAGSVILIHCQLLHYSAPNTSDRFRRAYLPAYRAADAFPIYFGPHAAHNEAGVTVLRGQTTDVARTEAGAWRLPLAERPFGSLFELQEGRPSGPPADATDSTESTGYATVADGADR